MIRYVDGLVQLEIADDGAGSAERRRPAATGSSACASGSPLYGGTLEAGPRDGGGFVLRAELPVEART